MPEYLSKADLPDPEVDDRDRTTPSGSPRPAATSDAGRTDPEPPHVREALRAIVRLLARQAARDHLARGECP